ncbi:single-stranded DNA-binding protein [Nocardioides sp. AE5]|uniref:single-stranded DNA-binding protein n=1 Tax=Nocardioides sp. AE5 TaxID=2962573 RepID=UPI002882568F|nr:single-stranded DNA-binding protein [Nocardioides sp. AE5]MDT0202745.1 single-stranded DNA-binding protein [Nocardioides sp. AE5]
MSNSYITVQGWVGTEPQERVFGETVVVSFRMASTPRRFDKKLNTYVDAETNWYTVNAWRHLGPNTLESLSQRDPVVVHGKLTTNVYKDSEGTMVQSVVIDALTIGHDLSLGTSQFTRAQRSDGRDDEGVKAMNADLGVGGGQVTSDGKMIDDLVTAQRGAAGVDVETGEILEESVA